MSVFSAIDLSALPAPEVVESLDFETILSEMLADLQARDSSFTALVESDPAYKILEVAAYREVNLRQRVNDAAKAVMLAYSTGTDLDNLAALTPLARDDGETDGDFRVRTQLAPEGFSTAGPDGAYKFHALAVSGVVDVAVDSPNPGEVVVYILAEGGDGTASADLISAVNAALSADDIRPLTDFVSVESAGIVAYQVTATLHILSGPSADSVADAAQESLEAYVADRHSLGLGVALSGIFSALHVSGVQSVELTTPETAITVTEFQAAYCGAINLTTVVD